MNDLEKNYGVFLENENMIKNLKEILKQKSFFKNYLKLITKNKYLYNIEEIIKMRSAINYGYKKFFSFMRNNNYIKAKNSKKYCFGLIYNIDGRNIINISKGISNLIKKEKYFQKNGNKLILFYRKNKIYKNKDKIRRDRINIKFSYDRINNKSYTRYKKMKKN